jgi:hypothetical protein
MDNVTQLVITILQGEQEIGGKVRQPQRLGV